MKELLIRLLALFGLVPSSGYDSLANQFDETHRSAHTWKTPARQTLTRVTSLEGEIEQQARLTNDAKSEVQKRRRAEAGVAASLQDQLAAAQKELILAREHLMAIEVKLDILEGAANVLDARMRTAGRQANRTGAAV